MLDEHRKAGNGHGVLPTALKKAMPADDRRTHPRYHFTAAAEALDALHRTRMNARTSDIGKGGCYVDTFSPFPLKTPVRLRLTCEKSSFVADASVVYSKTGMGMGLQFTSVEPQQMGVLDKWIGELSGALPPEFSCLPDFPGSVPSSAGNGASGGTNGAAHNGNGAGVAKEAGYVLNELIIALMRKGTLTDEEGKTMLLSLLHRDFLP
jgi:hypothetical protein